MGRVALPADVLLPNRSEQNQTFTEFGWGDLDIDILIKEEPGVDMLRPYCRATSVGVHSGDCDLYNLANACPNDDEYAEVDDFPNTGEGSD